MAGWRCIKLNEENIPTILGYFGERVIEKMSAKSVFHSIFKGNSCEGENNLNLRWG